MTTPSPLEGLIRAADLVIGPLGEVMKDREGPTGYVLTEAAVQGALSSKHRKVVVISASGWAANFEEGQ